MATSPRDLPNPAPAAPDAPPGREPLAVAFGRRLEAVESGLEEAETALRRLAHDMAGTELLLQRARAGLASAREAIRWVRHPVVSTSPPVGANCSPNDASGEPPGALLAGPS